MGPEHEGSGKSRSSDTSPLSKQCFNGAGARGLRKIQVGLETGEYLVQASMGPEHEGSGK